MESGTVNWMARGGGRLEGGRSKVTLCAVGMGGGNEGGGAVGANDENDEGAGGWGGK